MADISLAPSLAHVWMHCGGSAVLRTQYPDLNDDRTAREEGRAFHWLAEQMIKMFSDPKVDAPGPGDFIGTTAPNGVYVDDEMYQSAVDYTTDIFRYCNPYRIMRDVVTEARVDLSWYWPGGTGRADNAVFNASANELVVWDAKYGHSLVEAERNWQMIIYAESLCREWLLTDPNMTVRLRIVQPRGFHRDGPYREWSITYGDLQAFVALVQVQAAAILGNTTTVQVNPSICRRCQVRRACTAARNVGYDFIDMTQSVDAQQLTGDNLSLQLSMLKRGKQLIDGLISGLEEQVEHVIKNGQIIPGWQLEPTRGTKSWSHSPEDVFAMGDMMGVDLRKPQQPVTPTQAEKMGIDENVINEYSQIKRSMKLVEDDGSSARNTFRKEK